MSLRKYNYIKTKLSKFEIFVILMLIVVAVMHLVKYIK